MRSNPGIIGIEIHFDHNTMIPGSKGQKNRRKLACRRGFDLLTRQNRINIWIYYFMNTFQV